MRSNQWGLASITGLLLLISIVSAQFSFARGFGGGMGRPGGVGGPGIAGEPARHYENTPAVGNYRPGNGWENPAVIVTTPTPIYYPSNCQTVQQCNNNGTCIETNDCD